MLVKKREEEGLTYINSSIVFSHYIDPRKQIMLAVAF